jgi:hypothetical protein
MRGRTGSRQTERAGWAVWSPHGSQLSDLSLVQIRMTADRRYLEILSETGEPPEHGKPSYKAREWSDLFQDKFLNPDVELVDRFSGGTKVSMGVSAQLGGMMRHQRHAEAILGRVRRHELEPADVLRQEFEVVPKQLSHFCSLAASSGDLPRDLLPMDRSVRIRGIAHLLLERGASDNEYQGFADLSLTLLAAAKRCVPAQLGPAEDEVSTTITRHLVDKLPTEEVQARTLASFAYIAAVLGGFVDTAQVALTEALTLLDHRAGTDLWQQAECVMAAFAEAATPQRGIGTDWVTATEPLHDQLFDVVERLGG